MASGYPQPNAASKPNAPFGHIDIPRHGSWSGRCDGSCCVLALFHGHLDSAAACHRGSSVARIWRWEKRYLDLSQPHFRGFSADVKPLLQEQHLHFVTHGIMVFHEANAILPIVEDIHLQPEKPLTLVMALLCGWSIWPGIVFSKARVPGQAFLAPLLIIYFSNYYFTSISQAPSLSVLAPPFAMWG